MILGELGGGLLFEAKKFSLSLLFLKLRPLLAAGRRESEWR
jgi:hypothetical protein